MKTETLRRLLAARAAKRAVVLATRLADGAQWVLPEDGADGAVDRGGSGHGSAVPGDAPGGRPAGRPSAALAAAAANALARDESATAHIDGAEFFLQVQVPPYRLLIIGAVHIAQALAPLAATAGFAASVIDPRGRFASAERFPGITLSRDWPDTALAALGVDARTAVVTLSHDPKLDDIALDIALRGPAFYIGSLGSRRSHAARLERLAALGHDAAALARIRGPVGLPIGALTTGEIAISILAELVAVRRKSALAQR